jgi:hypothetical protein
LVSIKSNHMGIFLNNIKQWTNKMMLALDTWGWTTWSIYQNIVKKCVRFIQRKNWLIATHELCHIMFFFVPTLFVSCEQIALVDPSSNNLALWMMIHNALLKSNGWLPIATHQVLQYNKKTSHQLDIIFHINQKKIPLLCLTTTIWIPSSIAIIAWTHTCGAFYGMSPKYLHLVDGMCLVLIRVRVLYAICDPPWGGWIRLRCLAKPFRKIIQYF